MATTDDQRTAPAPEVFDHVAAPEGRTCQLWAGDEPRPCDADAEVLFVYEGSLRPGDDARRNALACADCAPIDMEGEHGE